jgi:hypothetical protein
MIPKSGYRNAAERRRKGQQARRDVVSQWTWDDAARIAHRRLQELQRMSRRKPVPDLIRDGDRFADQDMREVN